MRDYKPAECDWCKAETWCEIRHDGRPQCRGCKVVQFFTNVLYAPIGYKLLRWQERELRAIFGTVDPATGLRQYRRAYELISKKNGKTFVCGGLPIYHLLCEDDFKPEAYGAAATKEQASLVFKAAKELIDGNPELQKRLRVLPSTKRIAKRNGNGFYQVLSSDGKNADGIEPSLALFDEVHRWTTERARTLWEVMWKGQISRREPLGVMTTTAGSEDESLIWNEEHEYAQSVISGDIVAPTYYASIYQADERRVHDDPEYWQSREARVAANPSHEDLGGFLKDSAIVEELNRAVKRGNRNDYLRYHLGVRVTGTEENVIDIPQWITSTAAGGVDLREWPEYDADLLIRKWGLLERPAVVGVDASWSIDLSAVSVVFPPEADGIWKVLVWQYMPAGAVAKIEQTTQQPFGDWVRRGFIHASPGNAIDYEAIKQRIRWACEMFDVSDVAYDKWNFRATAMDLLDEGLPMVEVSQNFAQLSEPTKVILGAYKEAKLWHGNNPVLNFNARSLALQADRKDNVQPAKPDRLRTKKRIDGLAATVTAMNRGIVLAEQPNLDAFLRNPVRA